MFFSYSKIYAQNKQAINAYKTYLGIGMLQYIVDKW
jgi:hypothetical protein